MKISKSRQHYLHFDFHKTIKYLENNKISEDSSLGYNEHVGFRCGTGVPFYLFNWSIMAKSKVLERPLVWMDSSQMNLHKKTGFSFQDGVSHFFKNNKFNTQIEINIHNSSWVDFKYFGVNLAMIYEIEGL